MTEKVCERCGNKFRAHHSWNRFCSRYCSVRGRSGPTRKRYLEPNTVCSQCGTGIIKRNSDLFNLHGGVAQPKKHLFCSRKCFSLHCETRLGNANPNFKDRGKRVCIGCGKGYRSYDKGRRYCGHLCSQKFSRTEALISVRKGREAERRCVKELRKRGYIAFLSAASRGPADVIAISSSEILLIQVKYTRSEKAIFRSAWHLPLLKLKLPESPLIKRQLWHLAGTRWITKEVSSEPNPEVTQASP